MRHVSLLLLGLLATSPALAQSAAMPAQVAAAMPGKAVSPDGNGDANAITCRPPQILPGSRLLGPEVCKTNAVWA